MSIVARVLGIESSCDETAAAVVHLHDDGRGEVLSDVVASQNDEHAPYGGVVPEIASRSHMRHISRVVRAAIADAGGWDALDAMAVTTGPGLLGALLVGAQTAKALAYGRGIPIVGVHHLMGHLLAPFLDRPLAVGPRPDFPFVGLLASGGHTALYRVDGPDRVRELGATRDDAAGEAFDKVAKLCGLGYPGGPAIDRLAATGNPAAVKLPRPMRQRGSLEFSFSGLKTAVATHLDRRGGVPTDPSELADLAASVQAAIVDTLVFKLGLALEREGLSRAVISGGVAANRGLRARAVDVLGARGYSVSIPPASSCTDNAAMIAYAGAMQFRCGARNGDAMIVRATWPLHEAVARQP